MWIVFSTTLDVIEKVQLAKLPCKTTKQCPMVSDSHINDFLDMMFQQSIPVAPSDIYKSK